MYRQYGTRGKGLWMPRPFPFLLKNVLLWIKILKLIKNFKPREERKVTDSVCSCAIFEVQPIALIISFASLWKLLFWWWGQITHTTTLSDFGMNKRRVNISQVKFEEHKRHPHTNSLFFCPRKRIHFCGVDFPIFCVDILSICKYLCCGIPIFCSICISVSVANPISARTVLYPVIATTVFFLFHFSGRLEGTRLCYLTYQEICRNKSEI